MHTKSTMQDIVDTRSQPFTQALDSSQRCKTLIPQDHGTERPRDHETKKPGDQETIGPRDPETTRPLRPLARPDALDTSAAPLLLRPSPSSDRGRASTEGYQPEVRPVADRDRTRHGRLAGRQATSPRSTPPEPREVAATPGPASEEPCTGYGDAPAGSISIQRAPESSEICNEHDSNYVKTKPEGEGSESY